MIDAMTANPGTPERLRLGMVGGGPGAFIGAVHRMAARLDDQFELVAGVFTSDPARSRLAADELHVARSYAGFAEMAQAESKRPDRIDAVSIVTPNHLHYPVAKAFLEAGIHVICDKPVTATLAEALELEPIVKRSGLVFGLTHNYTGYPMVRQAREMILAGELGALHSVQVEYAQDWLSTALETTGQKQAEWRTDPARGGLGGALGDIGTHAFNLVSFVTGLACQEVAADASTSVPERRVPDSASALMRLARGVKGMLWATQVAPGNDNNLRLRVYGEKAGLDWRQEEPESLWFTRLGVPRQLIRRGGPGTTPAAAGASRLPAGHPEGYLEAFAQLYGDLAEQIYAAKLRRKPNPQSLLVPGIREGVEEMQFVDAVLESSRRNSAWVSLGGRRA
jgi:predicted dehydrogenase